MATTDLNLGEPGSLPRPGPVGRVTRLLFGFLCAWYVKELFDVVGSLVAVDGHIRAIIWNGVVPGLFLVSYVINIGYSRAWGKWPAVVTALALAAVAGVGYFLQGSVETQWLARALWVWEVYVFSHLALAFLIAGTIGTPGCEMRAFHHLYSRMTGVPTKEHACPVGPLSAIDQWETRIRSD